MRREGYRDPSWPDPEGPDDADIIIYGYVPSEVLCILALALFSIVVCIHVFWIARYKAWYLTPIVVACIMELIGYAFRFESAHVDPYRIDFFVLNYFFIVVAPVFLSASIYVCLSRLIRWAMAKGHTSPIHLKAKSILIVFITCDVVATVVQVTGAALIGHAEADRKDPTTSNNILLSGLAFQTASFLAYLVLLGMFSLSTLKSTSLKGVFLEEMGAFSCSLWVASILLFMRTIFRLAETSEGVFGFARTHEVFFGCFDFAPIIVATFLLAAWSPGKFLPKLATTNMRKEGV